MEFRVLGPTELWSGGQQCDLGPGRVRAVLAILLLNPRTIVPAGALIDRLWDTEPPPKARESLSVYVARLRASLRQAVGDGVRLAGRASGYVLDVDPAAVDLHRFRQLRRQADTAAASGDYEQAVNALREADGLWRGQALAGIRGDWVARMRDSLEEERRAAIVERVEYELALGRYADLVGELRGLVAQYPLDETLVAHQMTALYGSGRPADALSLYRETRGRLIDEQGAEPGPVLSEIHQRILRRDPALAVRHAGPRHALPARPDTPSTVIALTVGRVAGPAALVPAGADPVRRGAAAPASPEVMSAIELSYRALEPGHRRLLRLLGVSPCPEVSAHGAAALGGGTLAQAERALASLRDHHLLTHGPAGQYRLHDLIRGFAAARAAIDDPPSEQRQAVGRLLNYYLYTADRADRVLHPFRHRMPVSVAHPPSASPPLRAPDEATVWLESEWRNILRAAQHAGRHEWKRQCADLTHVLAGFVEIKGYWGEAIAAHALALQACRDLADPARIAQASLELSVVSQQAGRHEDTLSLAEDAAAIYRSLDDRRGLAEALDQIGLAHQRAARSREALAHFREARTLFGDAGDRHGMATTLSHSGIACWHLGRYPDAMSHLRDALALYRDAGDRRGEAKTLNNLGKVQLHCGFHRDALDSFRGSLTIFSEIGGAQNQAILHQNIGSVYRYKGSYEKGLAAYGKALSLYRDIGDLPNQANLLNDIGAIYRSAERYDEALVHYQQARLIAQDVGNLSEQVIALRGIADVHRGSGRYDEALDHYNAALSPAREIGDPYEEAKILEGIAETTLSTRKPHAARIVFRQALDIFERLGVPEAESARIRLETTDPALGRRTSLAARQLAAP